MPALPLGTSLSARLPYALLPASPLDADADSSSALLEKRDNLAHYRSVSLSEIGEPAPTKSFRRRRFAGLLIAAAGAVGLVVVLLDLSATVPWRTGQGELQYTPRHRIAVDFETTDVPALWSCNPFKEPGRLEVDVRDKVRRVVLVFPTDA